MRALAHTLAVVSAFTATVSPLIAQCEAVNVPGDDERCELSHADMRLLRERWLEGGKRERLLTLLLSRTELDIESFQAARLPLLERGRCAPTKVALDLRGADLRGGSAPLDLRGLRLNGADLRGATFQNVDLTQASFFGANLQGASFFDVDTGGAIFRCSVMDGVLMRGMSAVGTDFSATRGHGIDIAGTVVAPSRQQFSRVSISESDWTLARLTDLNFRDSTFLGTNLAGARITSSTFVGSTFERASLAEAILRGSGLAQVDLREADLSGLNVVASCLVDVSFEGALGREPANLHTSSVARLRLGQVPPNVLGLRSVRWGDGVPLKLCEELSGAAPTTRIAATQLDPTLRRQELIRTFAALREYYRSESGFNPTEARVFEYELAEERRSEYLSARELGPFTMLTLSYWFHGHWTRASRLTGWIASVVAAVWLAGSLWRYGFRRHKKPIAAFMHTVGEVWPLPIVWFFGLVENALNLRGVMDRLGWDSSKEVEQDLRLLLLTEAVIGAVWLFMFSSVALEWLLLP